MQEIDKQVPKSKRDVTLERLRVKYPERGFDDEEALFGQINDDYDQYDKDLAFYKDREDKMAAMYASDPRSAAFLTHWRDGADPAVELVRQFGTEIKEAIDDPARQEAIAEANKEYVQRVAKEKELDKEYRENLEESLKVIESYQASNGLSDQQVDDAMSWLMGIVKDGVMGKFSPESIDMAMKAISHDSDVATAGHEGEVRGRNSRIEERLRRREEGDGTPQLAGKNGDGGRRRPNSIFDLADEAR